MSRHAFRPPFDQLPASLPIFPLPNVVVMPGCQLPLNIFEPRYLNMVFDALGAERMIGIVQPEGEARSGTPQPLYQVGTAGRISLFQETEDGRLLIMLSGVCRFETREEIPTTRGYRRMMVDWTQFREDYEQPEVEVELREELMQSLKDYFEHHRLEADWDLLGRLETWELLDRLVAGLPIAVAERQMLVETVSLKQRLRRLNALLQCESMPASSAIPARPQ
ncbi:MAG: peptidase S16 [Methylococcaceae bacterium]|nr:peptidase S16 [Methylococcaceae bacterium]